MLEEHSVKTFFVNHILNNPFKWISVLLTRSGTPDTTGYIGRTFWKWSEQSVCVCLRGNYKITSICFQKKSFGILSKSQTWFLTDPDIIFNATLNCFLDEPVKGIIFFNPIQHIISDTQTRKASRLSTWPKAVVHTCVLVIWLII